MEIDTDRLKALRDEKVLSLRDLGELSGVSANTIWRLESGLHKQAHPRTIRKLATALGVEATELRKGDTD